MCALSRVESKGLVPQKILQLIICASILKKIVLANVVRRPVKAAVQKPSHEKMKQQHGLKRIVTSSHLPALIPGQLINLFSPEFLNSWGPNWLPKSPINYPRN